MIKYPKLSLAISALALALSAPPSAASAKAGAPRAPNVVVILADDLGYGDVGFHGGKEIPTPHLDRLAAGGTVFTSGYVTFATCAPSRAGLLTGRYPQRFGFERNLAWQPANPAAGLDLRETMLPAALRPAGYKSGLVGKWHLGSYDHFHPLSRGFDEFYGHLGGGKRYFPEDLVIENTLDCQNEPDSYRSLLSRGRVPVRTEDYLTHEFTREALEFVKRRAATPDSPFFLYLAYNAPHAPMQASSGEIAKFAHIKNEKRRTYAAMLSILDRGVGQLLDLLDEQNLSDDTLVFFLSDNGGPTKDNGSFNGKLRGGKGSAFEGGFRVPFVARWPGKIPAGQTYDKPVSSLDIFATVAAANGLAADPARPLDGVNLLPYVNGEITTAPHERIYFRSFSNGGFAMREGDHKIIRNRKEEPIALYDLATDISEKTDLAAAEPERLARMMATYQEWDAQMIEPTVPGLDMREWAKPQPPATVK